MATLEVLFDFIPVLAEAIEPRLAKQIQQAATDLATEARRSIFESPGGGRTYTRRGSTHTASAPGEAPANWTDALVGSITATGAGLAAEVHVDSPHGVYLEYGTSKMAPRPFLGPARDKEAEKLPDLLPLIVAVD